MRLLLDTHVLLWALADDRRLSARHRTAIGDSAAELFLSAASVWEIAIKRSLGKLNVPETVFETAHAAGCRPLAITWEHAQRAAALPAHHADSFDRMLIAQAGVEGLTLLSADAAFRSYDVALL